MQSMSVSNEEEVVKLSYYDYNQEITEYQSSETFTEAGGKLSDVLCMIR